MKIKLSIFLCLILGSSLLVSCGAYGSSPPAATSANAAQEDSVILRETVDMGQEYIDSFIFFGESTTYHLKSREVLTGGKATTQVLGNESGTAILDNTTSSTMVIYPETGETMTFFEAIERKKPTYLFMSFGLNGASYKLQRGEEYFKECYQKLIAAVRQASPSTKIILGSCYPVAKNMDMSRYTINARELNDTIRTLNGWTLELCYEEDLRYLDLYSIMTDGNGYLRLDYQVGDGHHLTVEAYKKIIEYIRTHGYK